MSVVWRHRFRLLVGLVGALLLPVVAHLAIERMARMAPPPIDLPAGEVREARPGLSVFGSSHLRRRGEILELGLVGDPAQIGVAHARLARSQMIENEGILFQRFEETVPSWPLRTLVLDMAQFRYRALDAELGNARRFELAAMATAFQPDPFADWFPTYQRHVYLEALYDIALSFEHSPLVGCTTFALAGSDVAGGETLLARAFDFEVDEVFDRGKAVFLVREAGKLPFASVAWPGLVGVMSGMNVAGVALVVHGGRAGRTQSQGEPVLHGLRRALGVATTTDEVVEALSERDVLVSHIVVVADAHGATAVIERVPGVAPHVRRLASRAVVTNHFEGPAASDPKNQRVRATTSTLSRRARGDELVAALVAPITVRDAVALLRDRKGEGGVELELGDRRAIDALIATHGVVMNTSRRVLWVSEGPHLLGRFVKFDLSRLLDADYDPGSDDRLESIPADPLLTSGEYERWRAGRR